MSQLLGVHMRRTLISPACFYKYRAQQFDPRILPLSDLITNQNMNYVSANSNRYGLEQLFG